MRGGWACGGREKKRDEINESLLGKGQEPDAWALFSPGPRDRPWDLANSFLPVLLFEIGSLYTPWLYLRIGIKDKCHHAWH